MPRIMSIREKLALRFINEYGCATKEQIKLFSKASDKHIENLVKGHYIRKDKKSDVYLVKSLQEIDEKMLLALEILSYFKDKAEWHSKTDFPYKISFFMCGQIFDIAVVMPGEEVLMTAAINRSSAEKVIVGIKTKDTVLRIEKPARYYIFEEKMFFYQENGMYLPDEEFVKMFKEQTDEEDVEEVEDTKEEVAEDTGQNDNNGDDKTTNDTGEEEKIFVIR